MPKGREVRRVSSAERAQRSAGTWPRGPSQLSALLLHEPRRCLGPWTGERRRTCWQPEVVAETGNRRPDAAVGAPVVPPAVDAALADLDLGMPLTVRLGPYAMRRWDPAPRCA